MKTAIKKLFGLYGKFLVTRTDGMSGPGEKHYGCDYFVLDLTHDPLAIPAVDAYATAAKAAGYDELAADLRPAVCRLERNAAPWTDLQPWNGPDGVAVLADLLEDRMEQAEEELEQADED